MGRFIYIARPLTFDRYTSSIFSDCPCGQNCIAGCENCDNPVCYAVAVLVLSTFSSFNIPIVVDLNGKV